MDTLTHTGRPSPVTLDCSRLSTSSQSRDTNTHMNLLLQWVSRYPDPSRVRVYVGNARRFREQRELKNALQSMGCRVTVRLQVTHA